MQCNDILMPDCGGRDLVPLWSVSDGLALGEYCRKHESCENENADALDGDDDQHKSVDGIFCSFLRGWI